MPERSVPRQMAPGVAEFAPNAPAREVAGMALGITVRRSTRLTFSPVLGLRT